MPIKYARKSFCGPVFEEELDEVLDQLEESGYIVSGTYLEHVKENHGGVPIDKFFRGGEIERFLNYADSYATASAKWRNFNANVVRSWIVKRVKPSIYPIASMPHGAFLCLEHSPDAPPKVVMWNNESYSEEYVVVAQSFEEFVSQLKDTPYDGSDT